MAPLVSSLETTCNRNRFDQYVCIIIALTFRAYMFSTTKMHAGHWDVKLITNICQIIQLTTYLYYFVKESRI